MHEITALPAWLTCTDRHHRHRCQQSRAENSSGHEITVDMQGKRIDCLATHPGIADTRLYSKLDTAGKLEAKGLNAYKTVFPLLPASHLAYKQCVNSMFFKKHTA